MTVDLMSLARVSRVGSSVCITKHMEVAVVLADGEQAASEAQGLSDVQITSVRREAVGPPARHCI